MNVTKQLRRLPTVALARLRRVATTAAGQGAEPYLVGGAVRDLLLGRATGDLDVVVVGDAPAVGAALAAEEGLELQVHEPFGTATLQWPDGDRLDLITARSERYPHPGALPVVAPGSLEDDLRRRDFSINAMAVALAPAAFGDLVDPLGGRADLAAGLIRALHADSFIDDPTRLLRAVRYERRLSEPARPVAIEPATLGWLRAAVADSALQRVSVDRVTDEFVRLLEEPRAASMVGRLHELGLLSQIHPRLPWDRAVERALHDLDATESPAMPGDAEWVLRLALLTAHLEPSEARAVAGDLHLPSAAARLLADVAALRSGAARLHQPLANSALGAYLDGFSLDAIRALAALDDDPTLRAQVRHYLAAVRRLVPVLNGDFIRALGVPPGPIYRDALAALLAHKRDNPGATAEDEARFLQEWLVARGELPGGEEAGG